MNFSIHPDKPNSGQMAKVETIEANPFKYDVAFSFLSQDEALATEVNDLLQDHLTTFLYSKRQGEVAGTDGEETFARVFEQQARVVVVLYRSGWGQTPWTRIEATAIRNRAYDHGYDFVIFMPMDVPPDLPKWLPKARLWVGLKRWGTRGAASVIEARAIELGGEPREETVEARAARLQRAMNFRERRRKFLDSAEGVNAANEQFDSLEQDLKRMAEAIQDSASSMNFQFKRDKTLIVVLGLGFGVSIEWRYRYSNSLDDAKLTVDLWDRHPPFPGITHFEPPRRLSRLQFDFDLTPAEALVWRESPSQARELDSQELASLILKHYMDEVDKQRASR